MIDERTFFDKLIRRRLDLRGIFKRASALPNLVQNRLQIPRHARIALVERRKGRLVKRLPGIDEELPRKRRVGRLRDDAQVENLRRLIERTLWRDEHLAHQVTSHSPP